MVLAALISLLRRFETIVRMSGPALDTPPGPRTRFTFRRRDHWRWLLNWSAWGCTRWNPVVWLGSAAKCARRE
jgi:hypothetical protein